MQAKGHFKVKYKILKAPDIIELLVLSKQEMINNNKGFIFSRISEDSEMTFCFMAEINNFNAKFPNNRAHSNWFFLFIFDNILTK